MLEPLDEGEPEVVLVAHDVGPIGGMERQLSILIGGLLERGWKVTVLSRTLAIPPHPALTWIRVPGPRRPFSLAYPWFALAGGALLLKHRRGRVVHSTGALLPNRTDLVTVHLCHRELARRGLRRASRSGLTYRVNAVTASLLSSLGERWCYSPARARCLVAVSNGLCRELARHTAQEPASIRIIPNGVDADVFRPDPVRRAEVRRALGLAPGDLVALFVGSEWERKGLRASLEGVADAPPWHLVVVGAGDQERYRGLSRRLGAEERTRFVAPTADTAAYYAGADAFVLPSAYETFSLVTYEAAASGLPLLATRVSGVEDLLVDGVNGWFLEPRASDISARLRELEAAPRLRRSMGRRSRAAAEGFGWSRAVAAYAELYRALAPRPERLGAEAASC